MEFSTQDILGCILLVGGTFINIFSLTFFLTRPDKGANEVLFICLNTVDIIICLYLVGAIPWVRVTHVYDVLYQVCDLWFYLSTFITCVLSIVRMIVLVRPFAAHIIKIRYIILSILTFILLLALPFLVNLNLFHQDEWDDLSVLVYYGIMSFAIVICALISSIIISRALWRSTAQSITVDKHRASITILIITFTYILFVLPYCILLLGYLVLSNLMQSDSVKYASLNVYKSKFIDPFLEIWSNFGMPLNSTINAVIYFVRIRELRAYVCNIFRKVVCIAGHNTTKQRVTVHMAVQQSAPSCSGL